MANNYESFTWQPQDNPNSPNNKPGVAQAALEGQTASTKTPAQTPNQLLSDPTVSALTNDVFPKLDLNHGNDVFSVSNSALSSDSWSGGSSPSAATGAESSWSTGSTSRTGSTDSSPDVFRVSNPTPNGATMPDVFSVSNQWPSGGNGATINDGGTGPMTVNNTGNNPLTINDAGGGPLTINNAGGGPITVNVGDWSGSGATTTAAGGNPWAPAAAGDTTPPAATTAAGGNPWAPAAAGGAPSGAPGELTPPGPNAPTTPDLNNNQLQVLNDISQAAQNPANAQQDLQNAAQALQSMGFELGNPLANTGNLSGAQANDLINRLGLNSVDQNGPNGPASFLSYMGRLVSHNEQANGASGGGASGDILEQIAADATGQTSNGQSSTFAPDATQANWLMAAMAWSLSKNSSGQWQLGGGAINDMGLGLSYASAAGGSNIMTDLNKMGNQAATINSQTADTFFPNPLTPQGMQQLEQTSGWSAQQIATDAVVGHLMINPGQITASEAQQFFAGAANMGIDPVDAGLLDNLPGGAQWAQAMANSSNPAAAALNAFLATNAQALDDPGLLADAVGSGGGGGGGGGYGGGGWA